MLNLKVEMFLHKISVEDIATLLNIHRNTASTKVNGKKPFSIYEAFLIKEKLFPDAELKYLFDNANEKDGNSVA